MGAVSFWFPPMPQWTTVSIFFPRDALKEQFRKDQTSSNAWPKSDSRKCPITQHEPTWDRFEGGGRAAAQRKAQPSPIWTKNRFEQIIILALHYYCLPVSGLRLAQGYFLLLFLHLAIPLPDNFCKFQNSFLQINSMFNSITIFPVIMTLKD